MMASASSSTVPVGVDVFDGDEMGGRPCDGGGAVTHGLGLHAGVAEAAVVHDGDGGGGHVTARYGPADPFVHDASSIERLR